MIIMLIIATLPAGCGCAAGAVSAAFTAVPPIGVLLFNIGAAVSGRQAEPRCKKQRGMRRIKARSCRRTDSGRHHPGRLALGLDDCGGLFVGFERQFAVRFAFLLSIPAVAAAAVFQLPDIASAASDGLLVYGVGGPDSRRVRLPGHSPGSGC